MTVTILMLIDPTLVSIQTLALAGRIWQGLPCIFNLLKLL